MKPKSVLQQHKIEIRKIIAEHALDNCDCRLCEREKEVFGKIIKVLGDALSERDQIIVGELEKEKSGLKEYSTYCEDDGECFGSCSRSQDNALDKAISIIKGEEL